ncbi:MAG: hypothetical protein JZD41_07895 [Thermoproteus sp.]|nr:hypothetical protein [Thermoproteus sp.]
MSVDPAVFNRDFMDCVDACHKQYKQEELMSGAVWEALMECLEKCWRRHARV